MKRWWRFKVAKGAAILAAFGFFGGTAAAQLAPVASPNGAVSGTIDGNIFELPVFCSRYSKFLDISSHNQVISNSITTGGVEPALNVTAFEIGYQVVVFVGGERYKFLRVRDTLDSFPFTLKREVRAAKIGKVEVDISINCPPL